MSDFYDKYNIRSSYGNNANSEFENSYKEAKYQDEIAGILKTANNEARRKAQASLMRKKARRRRIITRLTILLVATILVLVLVISGLVAVIRGISGLFASSKTGESIDELIRRADVAAASYDYDGAIEIIQSFGKNYERKKDLKQAVSDYESRKSGLVKYTDTSQVTHISFRTLIYDAKKAFDGDGNEYKYNRTMTTVAEFSAILDELYKQDYILISPYDLATKKKGKMVKAELYLPKGKKPIIISQEDVSYSTKLSGDGFASKIVIDKNNNPVCEYTDENGKTTTGNFDLIPILESFINDHPDFSYKGARGIIAVTGYDGVLGYRTNPDSENYSKADAEKAKKTADRLKELGWVFACNSYDYKIYGNIGIDELKYDADKWQAEVAPIVGETNILVYPDGTDIVSSGEYTKENEKYSLLKSLGFSYFLYGSTAKHSITYGEDYFRQGRRILSGFRLLNQADGLTDLFDANNIIDVSRPGVSGE